ncbi:MAG: DUF2460 domain-containing protein [Pseudomonadota bacterium]
MAFHEIRFPTDISRTAQGGPERRTEIVVTGSGHEERNSRWADSRRNYNAGYGVKSIADLYRVISFFEERRGRLYGFRWRDPTDWSSASPGAAISMLDQELGLGDGVQKSFQLVKTYGATFAPWSREIKKPVAQSVAIAVDGAAQVEGVDFELDTATGSLLFFDGHEPASGAVVTAGFEFDVPVRFDTDKLEINLQGFQHGAIPSIPIVEVRL